MPNPQVNARGDADTAGGAAAATDCCRIVLGTDTSIAVGTSQVLVTPWSGTVGPDPTGAWNAGAPDRLTPAPGYKRVWANVHWENKTATNFSRCYLVLNGTEQMARAEEETIDCTGQTLTDWGQDMSFIHNFVAGDYVQLYVTHGDGSALDLKASTSMGFSTMEGD